ncbi:MAG: hypothetical protein AB1432_04235 [Bacteroidota bacterium]
MKLRTHGPVKEPGKQVTINELVAQNNNLCNKNLKPVYEKKRPGDILHSYADIELIKKKLKYEPKFSFNAGLEVLISAHP